MNNKFYYRINCKIYFRTFNLFHTVYFRFCAIKSKISKLNNFTASLLRERNIEFNKSVDAILYMFKLKIRNTIVILTRDTLC